MKTELTKLLDAEKFAKIEAVFREHFQLSLETTDTKGKAIASMCGQNCHPAFCQLVRKPRRFETLRKGTPAEPANRRRDRPKLYLSLSRRHRPRLRPRDG